MYGVTRKSNLSHPDLHTTRLQAAPLPRYINKITGLSGASDLGVFNSDLDTLACSLLERMYFCKVGNDYVPAPDVDKLLFFCRLAHFRAALLKHQRRITPLSLEEVVETYTGRKRTLYENALVKLRKFGLRRSDAHSMSFVKVEKCKTTGAPRCIQPRKPTYNLVLGQYIKPLEHRLYRWIAKVYGDGPTVMKGYDVCQVARIMRGKWKSFSRPVAIGLDATKFDMHVSPSALDWEHDLYRTIFCNYPEIKQLLSWQFNNVGRGYTPDGKLKYKVKGKRFSGDMNTALGNCLIMCGLIYAYSMDRGVPVKLVNNGDDCVVFMEIENMDRFMIGLPAWFLEMGFRMTVEEPVYDFQRIEFCQSRPIRGGNGWTMVRNIRRSLEKDTLSCIRIDEEGACRKWMSAVGECGLALTAGVPIMQSFYEAYLRNGSGGWEAMARSQHMASGMRMNRGVLPSRHMKVSPEARLDVYIAWGITPEEQIAAEDFFDRWTYDHVPVDITDIPPVIDVLCSTW